MVVMKGYKQTEIGIIPEDWEVKRINELTPQNKKNGIVDGPFGSNLKTIHYRKSGIPIITSGYVTNGYFLANEYLYVDFEKFKQEKRSSVKGGDIVMAKIGERCGASAILPRNHQEGILSGNALKISIDENKYQTMLIWQILNNLHVSGKLEILRTTGAQPALSMANLKKFQIPLPPTLHEQTAIANALTDTDTWINSLEELLTKKHQIKQGAMQELLLTKEDWIVNKLGEITIIYKGKQYNSNLLNEKGLYPCYSGGVNPSGYSDNFNEESNSIIISEGGNSCGYVNFVKKRFWLGGHCYKLDFITNKYDQMFFYHLLKNHQNKIMDLRVGSGLPNIQKKSLDEFKISFPKLKEEQTRIATILSDMDDEIAQLETKLAKAKQIKQGMMQELLTGRIRLV